MKLSPALRDALAPWLQRGAAWRRAAATWYGQRAPREQRLLAVTAALAGAALLFLVLIEPAWTTATQARQDLPALRAQAASVADLTAQVRALRRHGNGSANAAPATAELAASLRGEGLPDDSWSLSEAAAAKPADGAAPAPAWTLTLREASAATVFRWLDTAARDWRLAVDAAELARATQPAGRRLPGRLSGTLTLRLAARS